MSPKHIGPIAQAWHRWKALRLPWRRRFFVGYDLEGNTYWEFRLTRGPDAASPASPAARWRRIVDCPRSTHYSDVRVSPLWHQWLRHMRPDAPSLAEQRRDVLRQERVKLLAAQADARWEAKSRLVDHHPVEHRPVEHRPVEHRPVDEHRPFDEHRPVDEHRQVEHHHSAQPPERQARPANETPAQAQPESRKGETRQHHPQAKPPAAAEDADTADPWVKARKAQGPSEKWQPTAWDPSAAKRR